MAKKLAELYREAKKAGHPASEIRGKSASEIEALLANGGGTKPVAKKKSAVKQAVAKKKATATKAKTTATKKVTAAKKTVAKATTKKSKTNGNGSGDGRHLLSKVNYSKDDGWNPREGSAPDRIIKSLKKNKGDRKKVFEALKSDVWDFVGKTKRNGEKRTKAEAADMLLYRIARTDWQFAVATGQHDIATKRADYGTAGTGAGTWKPAKGSAKVVKKSAKGAQKASKATNAVSDGDVKDKSDQALRKLVKSFEGKRGRRPAAFHAAEKELAKRARKAKK